MGQSQNGAVDWIEVEEDGNVEEDGEAILTRYDDQQNVERILMENNSKRFRLTETTPPVQEPLVGLLGYLGDTEAARQILDGTFVCPPELNFETRLFIEGLRVTSPEIMSNKISNSESKDGYQKYWKRAKERTSSSISGLHFGHWKAAADDDYLSEVHAVFTEIVVSNGFSPERWQQGLTVMQEKEPGIRLPDKLRAILLTILTFPTSYSWAGV